MASKVILLVLALCAVAAFAAPESRVEESPENRLVGGTPTTIEQFPFLAAYVYHYPGAGINIQRCVGSLVSSYHVLTTAFCFTGANLNLMLIRAGSTNSMSGGVLSTISEVIIHPDYVASPRLNDIAVTILTFPLPLSNTIDILYLPPQNWYIPDGQSVQVISWGFVSEQGPQLETLSTANLYKVPLSECQEAYAENEAVLIDDPVICAAQPEARVCTGDSGAPMVISNVVVGLSSYHQDCSDSSYPDVFTRIDRFTDWILEVAVPPASSYSRNVKIPTPRVRY